MTKTLSTFLGIAITVVVIGALLFGVAYSMEKSESEVYTTNINNARVHLP